MGRSVDFGRVLRGGARHGPQLGVEINGGEPGNRRRLLRDGVPSTRSQSKGLVDHVADRLRFVCQPSAPDRGPPSFMWRFGSVSAMRLSGSFPDSLSQRKL